MTLQEFSAEIWADLSKSDDQLYSSEENATFWLWAYPALIGWPRRFQWLFSPVTGKHEYPGDLWGVDEDGNIIVIETKRGNRADPFQDFLFYEKNMLWKQPTSREQLLKKWRGLFDAEREFWNKNRQSLSNQTFEKVTARGIVPYSSKRYATWRWSILYMKHITRFIFDNATYEREVVRFLEQRAGSSTSRIFYVGLAFVKKLGDLPLSQKGENCFQQLTDLLNEEHVVLLSMTAQELPERDEVLIETRRESRRGNFSS